jgi:hypothetical protein
VVAFESYEITLAAYEDYKRALALLKPEGEIFRIAEGLSVRAPLE